MMLWLGLGIMIMSETATILRVEPFYTWNTPIAWTGFILFADGIVFRARGDSWIRCAPREFVLLALVSIPLWLIFEGYNRIIANWSYSGLPENPALRLFGYAWSFATISPALFEAAELIAVVRGRDGRDGRDRRDAKDATPSAPSVPSVPSAPSAPSVPSVLAGALMLASPFLVSRATARYLAAPVWLGFIFLLDPINARLGAESLRADIRAGRYDRIINLSLGGVLCGALWELWNFWAGAKWHYSVPIMERWKIFEMPLPGYFGFPPFALECFTMYVFVRRLVTRDGRRVGL
ncbi:MAG TPA: hypothetical protein VKE51_09505 [Vicinamibacterales bacterium]|nr:hypothetical protein [Vicinamibacterales bacterium]